MERDECDKHSGSEDVALAPLLLSSTSRSPPPQQQQQQRQQQRHRGSQRRCVAYVLLRLVLLLVLLLLLRPSSSSEATDSSARSKARLHDVLSPAAPAQPWSSTVLSALLGVVALTTVAFGVLQASDPGYLDDDVLARAALDLDLDLDLIETAPARARAGAKDQAAKELRPRDARVAINDDSAREEEWHSSPRDGASSSLDRCRHERAHRLKRLEQIEAALLAARSASASGARCGSLNDRGDAAVVASAASGSDSRAVLAAHDRFCADCAILPPLRSHHCRACRRCVATFDHHCFLLGTCIGERNHARFWCFLSLQSTETALALAILHSSAESDAGQQDAMHIVGVVVATILWLVFAFVFGLWVFHTFLALTNSTTFEVSSTSDEDLFYLQGFRECDLPFSRGVLWNLQAFCYGEQCDRPRTGKRGRAWQPRVWELPAHIERDSSDVCSNVWENKYYSCC